jgi:hypothetical protein
VFLILSLVRPALTSVSRLSENGRHGRVPVAAVDALLLAADAEAVLGPAPLFDVAPPLAHSRHRSKGKQTNKRVTHTQVKGRWVRRASAGADDAVLQEDAGQYWAQRRARPQQQQQRAPWPLTPVASPSFGRHAGHFF